MLYVVGLDSLKLKEEYVIEQRPRFTRDMNDTSSRKISCFYTPDLTSSPFSFLCRSRVSIHLHLVPNESQPSSLAATQASAAKRPIPCLLCSYIYRPRLPGGAQAAALLALLCSAPVQISQLHPSNSAAQAQRPLSSPLLSSALLLVACAPPLVSSRGESNLSFLASLLQLY